MQTKEKLIELLSKEDTMVLNQAYLYAKNYVKYGEDVTEKWVTATQNARALEKAYREGYCDALQRLAESEDNEVNDIEKRKEWSHKPCINYEDGCEEWAGCPCGYYEAESEVEK